jgi:hypothetical protein
MKKVWPLLVMAFLLACACPSVPILSSPAQDATQAPIVTETMSIVRLYPVGGDLSAQLRAAAPKAAALGQHMFVEFDATW